MKINRNIPVTVGIYSTTYRLTLHRNGDITLRSPYIKWVNNTGSLAFKNTTLSCGSNLRNAVVQCFKDQTTLLRGYPDHATLADVDFLIANRKG